MLISTKKWEHQHHHTHASHKTDLNCRNEMTANDNEDVLSVGLGDQKEDSQLKHIYWYIGDEKYYPSYPPLNPASAAQSMYAMYANLLTAYDYLGVIHKLHKQDFLVSVTPFLSCEHQFITVM